MEAAAAAAAAAAAVAEKSNGHGGDGDEDEDGEEAKAKPDSAAAAAQGEEGADTNKEAADGEEKVQKILVGHERRGEVRSRICQSRGFRKVLFPDRPKSEKRDIPAVSGFRVLPLFPRLRPL